ncbi:MAG: pentapeptide repeat-containing protein [Pseudonocardiaceae bacterium]
MVVLIIGVTAFIVLWWRYRGAGPAVELDAVRTAGALMAGAGGAIALLLSARRQRSTELTLVHQREVAQATERDAAEQRITELYTRAVDQLGAEKAPVRLGSLHALERLAQNNPAQRQTIVDVICAYLRMPFTPPDDQAPDDDAPMDMHDRYGQCRQELQVRLTAQSILTAHLNPQAPAVFWADIDLNLAEAHLHQLSLSACHVRRARFDGAMFAGGAGFNQAKFSSDALFDGAKFTGYAGFKGTEFVENAKFVGVEFVETADFVGAKFTGKVWFCRAEFTGWHVWFREATFIGDADFHRAKFAQDGQVAKDGKASQDVLFDGARFTGSARFSVVEFGGKARFVGVKFAGNSEFRWTTFVRSPELDEAAFTGKTEFHGARVGSSSHRVQLPMGWTTVSARPEKGEEGWLYVVRDQDSSKQPTEEGNRLREGQNSSKAGP